MSNEEPRSCGSEATRRHEGHGRKNGSWPSAVTIDTATINRGIGHRASRFPRSLRCAESRCTSGTKGDRRSRGDKRSLPLSRSAGSVYVCRITSQILVPVSLVVRLLFGLTNVPDARRAEGQDSVQPLRVIAAQRLIVRPGVHAELSASA